MKKELLLAVAFLISIPLMKTLGYDEHKKKADDSMTPSSQRAAASSIDGAWKRVYYKRNDTLFDAAKNPQLKMFHDGNFMLIAHDSTGKFSSAGYGKFELDGINYKETFVYHTNARFVGGIDWQEHEVRGDTLYARGFKKIIIGGIEQTGIPRIEEKRVRVKQ